MAKGLRASVRKENKAKLRATVFGPADDARTARLSAKLQELVSRPKEAEMMDVNIIGTITHFARWPRITFCYIWNLRGPVLMYGTR